MTARLLSLEEAARRMTPPGRSAPILARQVYRWVRNGVRPRGARERIRLRGTQMPAGLCVAADDLDEFAARLSAAREGGGGSGRGGRPTVRAASAPGPPGRGTQRTRTRRLRRCPADAVGTHGARGG